MGSKIWQIHYLDREPSPLMDKDEATNAWVNLCVPKGHAVRAWLTCDGEKVSETLSESLWNQ